MKNSATASTATQLATKPIHIFRAGRHTPMDGEPMVFSEARLRSIAKSYDPKRHEAPIVIGHPADDAPAYGWVKSLHVGKDGLYAHTHQVNPKFAEGVRKGSFKKISAAFYTPSSPDNPHPGQWTLRHVGFLGAQPPAVKGLRAVSFSERDAGVVVFEESFHAPSAKDEQAEPLSGKFAKLKAWAVENLGEEAAEALLPQDKLDQLQDDAPDAALPTTDIEAIEPDTPAEDVVAELASQVVEQAEAIAELASENEKLQEQLQAEEDEDTRAQAAEFAERLIGEGRLLPRHRATVVAALEVASGKRASRNTSGVVEFGEGARARPLLPAFKAFLASLPPAVQFAEVASKARVGTVSKPAVNPLLADAQRRAAAFSK